MTNSNTPPPGYVLTDRPQDDLRAITTYAQSTHWTLRVPHRIGGGPMMRMIYAVPVPNVPTHLRPLLPNEVTRVGDWLVDTTNGAIFIAALGDYNTHTRHRSSVYCRLIASVPSATEIAQTSRQRANAWMQGKLRINVEGEGTPTSRLGPNARADWTPRQLTIEYDGSGEEFELTADEIRRWQNK